LANARRFAAHRRVLSPNFQGDLLAQTDGCHVDCGIDSKRLGVILLNWLAHSSTAAIAG
jgi:hypothetical protein